MIMYITKVYRKYSTGYVLADIAFSICSGLLLYFIYLGIDTIGIETYPQQSNVSSTAFYSAHTKPTVVGKAVMATYVPAKWTITLDNNITCTVSKEIYTQVSKESPITFYKGIGRLSGTVYCKGASL